MFNVTAKQSARVATDNDGWQTNLLWRNIKRHSAEINFYKRVCAWDDAEQPYNNTVFICIMVKLGLVNVYLSLTKYCNAYFSIFRQSQFELVMKS